MTTDTEALRAQFEREFAKPPYEFELSRLQEPRGWVGHYTSYKTQCAWDGYQSGYAAAKAETATSRLEIEMSNKSSKVSNES